MTTSVTPNASTRPHPHPTIERLALNDCGALLRLKQVLTERMTQTWPTRLKPLTPAALAASVAWEDIELGCAGGIMADPGLRALVLLLPDEHEAHLQVLMQQMPTLRLHPDLDLRQQGAYVSWTTGCGQPPQTVWVEADAVMADLCANERLMGLPTWPVVMVAGQSVAVCEHIPQRAWVNAVQAGISAATVPPPASAAALQAAQEKAQKYSARPWLFMRYELYNRSEHLAVNWAPLQRMRSASRAGGQG